MTMQLLWSVYFILPDKQHIVSDLVENSNVITQAISADKYVN